MDSNDISDLHNRNHGNYMMSRYNDVDSIPDDVGKTSFDDTIFTTTLEQLTNDLKTK